MSGNLPDAAPVFANTCYSFINDHAAMHVANVYRYDAGKKMMVSAYIEKANKILKNLAKSYSSENGGNKGFVLLF